jgi:hypothetical protein
MDTAKPFWKMKNTPGGGASSIHSTCRHLAPQAPDNEREPHAPVPRARDRRENLSLEGQERESKNHASLPRYPTGTGQCPLIDSSHPKDH